MRLRDRIGISEYHQSLATRLMEYALVGMLAIGFERGGTGIVVNSAVGILVVQIPSLLERDYDIHLDPGLTLWITSAVFLHAAGTVGVPGSGLGFYKTLGWYDHLTHALSASVVAAVGYTTVRAIDEHSETVSLPPRFVFLFILSFTVAFGVLWEVLEFAIGGVGVLTQYGLHDTMLDLVFDVAGGVLVGGGVRRTSPTWRGPSQSVWRLAGPNSLGGGVLRRGPPGTPMRNFTVGRIWGIPIRINVSLLVFLPVLAWLIGSGTQIDAYAAIVESFAPGPVDVPALKAGSTPWVVGVAAGVGLFVSVLLHELGHSWVALRYDLEVESITLWILGGIASFKSLPKEWQREFWIAIAGPITSVAIGVVCLAGVQVVPASSPVLLFVVGWLAITNGVLAVFNMLPAFPMDGGRILRALLARNRSYASATRIAARVGVSFAIVFALLGVLSFSPLLLLLALFVYGAATTESRITTMTELLDGITVGDVMRDEMPSVETTTSLAEFTDRMIRDRSTTYLVTEAGRTVRVVSLADLKRAGDEDHASTTVDDVATREVPRLAPATPLMEAIELFGQTEEGVVFVEDEGEVVGAITSAVVGEVMQFQRESEFAVSRRTPM